MESMFSTNTRGPAPYSGASTPRFDMPYDNTFGTPRDLFDMGKQDYFSSNQLQSTADTPYKFPSGFFGNSPYPNTMDITPPQTATDPPPGWPYGDRITEQPVDELSLPASELNSSTAKIHYGQTTPPDETVRETDLDDLQNGFTQSKSKRQSTSSIKSTKPSKRTKKNKSSTTEESVEENDKRGKFLERNRVAASKCRQKKKEHNGQLEVRAKELERTNAHLKLQMQELLNEKTTLMMQMALHTSNGCDCHQIHQHLASFKALYQTPIGADVTSNTSPAMSPQSAIESIE